MTMQSPKIQTAIVGYDAMRRAEASPVMLDRVQDVIRESGRDEQEPEKFDADFGILNH